MSTGRPTQRFRYEKHERATSDRLLRRARPVDSSKLMVAAPAGSAWVFELLLAEAATSPGLIATHRRAQGFLLQGVTMSDVLERDQEGWL